jgi:hypothetical protein
MHDLEGKKEELVESMAFHLLQPPPPKRIIVQRRRKRAFLIHEHSSDAKKDMAESSLQSRLNLLLLSKKLSFHVSTVSSLD